MNGERGYRLAAGALLLTMLGMSAYFRGKADKEGGRLREESGVGLTVLRLLGLAAIGPLLGYLVRPSWVGWARFAAPRWMRLVGVGMTAAMVPLLYWVLRSLGRNISPSHVTREGHTLVTRGPYRWIRHPLYTVASVAWMGLGLMTRMWWLLLGWGPVAVFVVVRTRQEEAELIAAFGDEYRAYMARTGRYLPGVARDTRM